VFNNGQLFDTVALNGRLTEVIGSNRFYVGDAILLTTEQTTMVTDIIIDDSYFNTSPGSAEANLSSEWKFHQCNDPDNLKGFCSCDLTEKAWTQNCRPWRNLLDFAWNTSYSGEAVFTPTISVPGDYTIYEWHGNLVNQTMGTNVKYTINYSGQNQEVTVNQQQDQGQWNYLGIYNLSTGTNNNVTISAQGSDGFVIADAIRFVYQGNHGSIKGPPGSYTPKILIADFNCDNQINIIDFGILLSHWRKSSDNPQVRNTKRGQCTEAKNLDITQDAQQGVDEKDLAKLLSCWGSPSQEQENCWAEAGNPDNNG